MRIVIDMQGAQSASRFRGIGRYTLALVLELVKNRGDHDVFLVLNGLLPESIEPIRASFKNILPSNNIRVWHAIGPVNESDIDTDNNRMIAELLREDFIMGLEPDVLLISSVVEGYIDDAVVSISAESGILVGVILYDLIPLLNPKQYLKSNPKYEKHYLEKIEHLSKADFYLAISDASRSEAIDSLSLDSSKVVSISAAISDRFREKAFTELETDLFKKRFGLRKAFVLYTGASDERKNLHRLIQAYAALPCELRSQYQLVLGCGMDASHVEDFKKTARAENLKEGDVCLTGYLTDEDLIQLYNLCDLYVFPSWHEGFGLPVLEAMACGAPAIGSNSTSIPEVIGLDEALFDPFSVVSIMEKMKQVLSDESFATKLRVHGLKYSKRFSWESTARKAIAAFEKFSDCKTTSDLTLAESRVMDNIVDFVEANPSYNIFELANCLAKNYPLETNKQILIDVSELIQRDAKSGIQRVVRQILQIWLAKPPVNCKIKPVYAKPDKLGYYYASGLFAKCGADLKEETPIDYAPGDIFLGLDFCPLIQTFQESYYQTLRRQGVKIIFIVYDLLSVLSPQFFLDKAQTQKNFADWLNVVSQNHGAVCISKSVSVELNDYFDQLDSKKPPHFEIDWFHLGADIRKEIFYEDCNYEKLGLNNSYNFLMVGTIEPRKGHSQILDAFEILWKQGFSCNLIFIGKKGWMVEPLTHRIRNHAELNIKLFWKEGADDAILAGHYSNATCLIAASYGEGFGLPLIEAAQNKLPIIARDIPVFREVASDYAYYFESESSEQVAENIQQWLELYRAGDHPKPDGMPWLTWEESAEQLIHLLLS